MTLVWGVSAVAMLDSSVNCMRVVDKKLPMPACCVAANCNNDDDDDELMLNVLRCHETY